MNGDKDFVSSSPCDEPHSSPGKEGESPVHLLHWDRVRR